MTCCQLTYYTLHTRHSQKYTHSATPGNRYGKKAL